MLNIFITGIDTNVGKTFITAGISATMQSLGYSTCVYKPIQTGAIEKNGFMQSPDLAFVKNIDPYIRTQSDYLLKEFSPPCIAAESENITIDKNLIKKNYDILSRESDCIIVEGTGGIMTPVAPSLFMSDIIKTINIPIVIIINPGFGTVNNTLLTINYAKERGINVRGIIINNFPETSKDVNTKTIPRLIEEYSDAKILDIIKSFDDIKRINPNDLITHVLNGIDIESVFDVKIAKLDIE